MDKKKRHHFVWMKYLKPWTINGKIYCCMNQKIFRSGLKKIAVRKNFYNVTELSNEEIEVIRKLFIEPAVPILQDMHNNWIKVFQVGFKLRNRLEGLGMLEHEIEEKINIAIHNAEENLHANVESKAIVLLDSILKGDTSFYSSDQGCIDFSIYLSEQYVRTANIKSKVIKNLGDIKLNNKTLNSIDFNRLWNLMSHIIATDIAYELYKKSDSMKMILLKRHESRQFITGDQPIINTFAMGLSANETVEELEFYYPVSPDIAILITDRNPNCETISLNDNKVDHFNKMIADQSDSQIYGTSEHILKDYSTKKLNK